MSPIADIQARLRELGRIRLGYQEDTGRRRDDGRPITRPVRLDRFRLTSPSPALIHQAAELYGGTPQPWDNLGNPEHQVVIEAHLLPVLIPTAAGIDYFDQWYELWGKTEQGIGLLRRCTGEQQAAPNLGQPCACPTDPADRDDSHCKAVTRLKVMLPEVADFGVWLLSTHSFHAACELKGTARVLELAAAHGLDYAPADLVLREHRTRPQGGEPGRRVRIPAISFRGPIGPILSTLGAIPETPALPAPAAAPPAPVPAAGPGDWYTANGWPGGRDEHAAYRQDLARQVRAATPESQEAWKAWLEQERIPGAAHTRAQANHVLTNAGRILVAQPAEEPNDRAAWAMGIEARVVALDDPGKAGVRAFCKEAITGVSWTKKIHNWEDDHLHILEAYLDQEHPLEKAAAP